MQIVNCQLCGRQIEIEYGKEKHWVCDQCIWNLAKKKFDLNKARELYVYKLNEPMMKEYEKKTEERNNG